MSDQKSVLERLRSYRRELGQLPTNWPYWQQYTSWAAKTRPFLRRHFLNDLQDFENLLMEPAWSSVNGNIIGMSKVNAERARVDRINGLLMQAVREGLLGFLDTLIQETRLSIEDPSEAVSGQFLEGQPLANSENFGPDPNIANMPYRPYKWYVSQSIALEDYHHHIQAQAITSGVEEQALQASGGRLAVFQSIRRRMPSFSAAEAVVENGPAWVQLKPVLVRCGLNVDENATLLDIKAFLDATSPSLTSPSSEAPKERPVPDPKRVFVIFGRNKGAYDEMVKFLRALKLDPKSFYDLSAECGPNPTVLNIVRHGMEQAAGVVALFTPDEWAAIRPRFEPKRRASEETMRWQARPNVIFEAGLALGLAEGRTILVSLGGDVRLFSDIGGIHRVDLNNHHETRNLLRGKLRSAGCLPDMDTGDHLSVAQAGDFEECVDFSKDITPTDSFSLANSKRKAKLSRRNRG